MMNILETAESIGLQVQKKTALESSSPCPFCGGKDRFILSLKSDRFWCRQCQRKGDAIQLVRDARGLGYLEACKAVGVAPREKSDKSFRAKPVPVRNAWTPKPDSLPSELWQEKAVALVEQCQRNLRKKEHQDDLDWLILERRLTSETIRKFRLGWNTAGFCDRRASWGLSETVDNASLYVPAGLVIPIYQDDKLIRVKVRIPERLRNEDGKPYHILSGSSSDPALIGDRYAIILVVESELDAFLALQSVSDFASVLCLGSVVYRPTEGTYGALMNARAVLSALDSDKAGAKEHYAWWTENVPQARRWLVPKQYGKDLTEGCQHGLDIREWLFAGLFAEDKANLDWFIERSAIMEYDGGLERRDAERKALADIKHWKE